MLFSELYWLDGKPSNLGTSSLVGCVGVVYSDDGPFASTCIKLPNGSHHRANCLKENLAWVKSPVLQTGDKVKVLDHKGTLEQMQEGHGAYTEAMELVLGRCGYVLNVRPFVGCKVEFELVGRKLDFLINSCLLEKVSEDIEYKPGDKVKVTDNLHRFKVNQNFHGGWNETMERFAGKVGSVVAIRKGDVSDESLGDLSIRFFGVELQVVINPRSVEKYTESFSTGNEVVFVMAAEVMTKLSNKMSSYTSSNLQNKQNQVGKVTSLSGSCENATVTVKYPDGKSLKFLACHLVRASQLPETPSGGGSVVPTLQRETTEMKIGKALASVAAAISDGGGSSMEPRNGLAPGDYVTCCIDVDTVKLMQEEYGGWNDRMKGIIGATSLVKGFNGNGGVVISTRCDTGHSSDEWHMYGGALTKIEGSTRIVGLGDHVSLLPVGKSFLDSDSDGDEDGQEAVISKCLPGDGIRVVTRNPDDNSFRVFDATTGRVKKRGQPVLFIGDEVMIYNNSELISALQSDVKLSVPGNISQILGKVGKVFKISKMVDIGVKFNLSDGKVCEVHLNARLLFKVGQPAIRVGDKVEVIDDEDTFKSLQHEHGGWNDSMGQLTDESGSVVKIFKESSSGHKKDDLVVLFPGTKEPVVINPAAVAVKNNECFSIDEDVVCVLPIEVMKTVLPKGHIMKGFKDLKEKVFEKGEVSNVEGKGEYAIVTVKYPDGKELTFFGKHLHSASSFSGDLAAMFLDAMNTFLAMHMSGGENQENAEAEEEQSSDDSETEDSSETEVTPIVETLSPNNQYSTNSQPSAPSDPAHPEPRECPVCFENENIQWACFPNCGHVICQQCAEKVINDSGAPGHKRCPMDNQPVANFIKLFL
ncbi:uncharacterized protein LOC142346130 [Convolutriloba macropyga]|uniref:uncharacterized protein LOC142346130 n=1 Tax=Convolutriloba macropyga TaxID=536237 RepID=UPI003F51F184